MVYQSKKISLIKGKGFITHIFQNQNFSLNKGGFIKGGGLLIDPVYCHIQKHQIDLRLRGKGEKMLHFLSLPTFWEVYYSRSTGEFLTSELLVILLIMQASNMLTF